MTTRGAIAVRSGCVLRLVAGFTPHSGRTHRPFGRRVHRNSLSMVVSMARVESVTLQAGFSAPDFQLPEPLTGGVVKLSEYSKDAKATVIMFICNHCPFVIHLKPAIVDLAKEYQARNVAFVAISSNSVDTHPQDGPEMMAEDAKRHGYTFPYLYDESQDVAKAYQAACTPEFLVFDKDRRLVYHGQFDDSRPASKGGSGSVTGKDIRAALECALADKPFEERWTPSIGCNIKWKPGNAPDWYHGI